MRLDKILCLLLCALLVMFDVVALLYLISFHFYLFDRTILVWSNNCIRARSKTVVTPAMINRHCIHLRGHTHAISHLVFAPDSDLILGCGFDYEVGIGMDGVRQPLPIGYF